MRFSMKNGILNPIHFSAEDSFKISQIPTISQPQFNAQFPFNQDLQKHLIGKQLLLDDIPFTLEIIQAHYENGYLIYKKGIDIQGKQLICQRCGNKNPQLFSTFPCSKCGEICYYCRHCIMMGRISECTPLISWCGPVPDTIIPTKIMAWQGMLSEGQQEASNRVADAIKQNKEWLIWAVCGAGKTEVLFEGIQASLATGKRICIATPRTDVVLELAPRLKSAFPEIPIATLYGGSEDRHMYASLTIATTHQLLRFYHAFDAIILDEVDAFPYTVEESLQYAAIHARKLTSAMIYLTATPNEKWQRECRYGRRSFTTIPARFHRYPLPVPRFEWCGNWKKQLQKGKLPPNVLRYLQKRIQIGKQALVFFPHIELMEKALPILQQFSPKIEAVHAEDPERKEKVQRMRAKQTPLLLTTTILERGVTFPNIDVVVVGAEEAIFSESALVQIAGRAGRSKDFPYGDVTFFHYGKTSEMLKAKKQIMSMNREGVKRGLIEFIDRKENQS
ncbi:DEAD/DEAH box helicase [Bacillus sp. JJ1764]|uniref:DEAD/DEAH box helicase n=1 Tax=Bacillus sp. JJ1764 TaxID=3122964 RepID=UPI002FFF5A2E